MSTTTTEPITEVAPVATENRWAMLGGALEKALVQ
jgi:hypothetical protein